MSAMSAAPARDCISTSVPPLKSMPKFMPQAKNRSTDSTESAAEKGNATRRSRMKWNFVSVGMY